MQIRKVGELAFTSNDLYIILTVGNRLLINHNDDAVTILDRGLCSIAQIALPQVMDVYCTYKADQQGLAFLYCPDDSAMVVLSVVDDTVRVLPLPDDTLLSPLHYWTGTQMLVATYGNEFRLVDRHTVKSVPAQTVKAQHLDFYQLAEALVSHDILAADERTDLVFVDRTFVVRYDHLTGQRHIVNEWVDQAYQAVSDGRYLVLVAEKVIHVHLLTGGQSIQVRSPQNRRFIRAAFIPGSPAGRLVVASSEESNCRMSYLEQYEIL